jgi:hypothetical protein
MRISYVKLGKHFKCIMTSYLSLILVLSAGIYTPSFSFNKIDSKSYFVESSRVSIQNATYPINKDFPFLLLVEELLEIEDEETKEYFKGSGNSGLSYKNRRYFQPSQQSYCFQLNSFRSSYPALYIFYCALKLSFQ